MTEKRASRAGPGANRLGSNAAKLSPRTNTDFTIASLGINGLNVGGPSGRPLRKDEQGFPVLNITGYMGLGDSGAASNLDFSRTYQFVDNVTGEEAVVAGTNTWDLSVTWAAVKGLNLTAGVTNLFNQTPPYSNQTSAFQIGLAWKKSCMP